MASKEFVHFIVSHILCAELFVAFFHYSFNVCGESVAIFSNSFLMLVICVCSLFSLSIWLYRFIKSINLLKEPALASLISLTIFNFSCFCSYFPSSVSLVLFYSSFFF